MKRLRPPLLVGWRYADERESLKLLDLYDAATGRHSHGTPLSRNDQRRRIR